eukprot:6579642-Prymnesium_polylepis.1
MRSATRCPCKRTRTRIPDCSGSPPHAPPIACVCHPRSNGQRCAQTARAMPSTPLPSLPSVMCTFESKSTVAFTASRRIPTAA